MLAARLILAGVFLLAGAGKLADRPGSRQALVGFGVSAAVAAPLAVVLPVAELAVAVMLVPTASARVAAGAALALLSAFVVGITANLAAGRRPDCHCFGQLHSTPIGASTLGRNTALAALAAGVVGWGPGTGIADTLRWVGDLSGAGVAALVAIVLLCLAVTVEGWLIVNMLRQNGRLLLRVDALEGKRRSRPAADGLPVGVAAPSFTLTDLHGAEVGLAELWGDGRPAMLVFVDPRCTSCKTLYPEIGRWRQQHGERLAIGVISAGNAQANQSEAGPVLLQRDAEVAKAYRIPATPSALLVRPDGRVASRVVSGADAIRGLLAQALHGGDPPPPTDPLPDPPKLGEAAHDFTLPGLYGHPADLVRYRGKELVVVFWSPSCGFCQKMLPDLKAWEANPPQDAPQILLVSSGTADANRQMGLRSPIVLQDDFRVGRRYGADGTPSAILLDADGNVDSELVVGATDVLGLLRFDPRMSRSRERSASTTGAGAVRAQKPQPTRRPR